MEGARGWMPMTGEDATAMGGVMVRARVCVRACVCAICYHVM